MTETHAEKARSTHTQSQKHTQKNVQAQIHAHTQTNTHTLSLFLCLPGCLSICLSICLSVYLSLSVCLTLSLFSLSIFFSVSLFVYLSLSLSLSVPFSLFPSLCRCVSLFGFFPLPLSRFISSVFRTRTRLAWSEPWRLTGPCFVWKKSTERKNRKKKHPQKLELLT